MADPKARQNGFAIRAIRELRGMSRVDLADRIGCSESALSGYETESRPLPIGRLDRIATALDVDRAALVRERPILAFPSEIRSGDRPAVA